MRTLPVYTLLLTSVISTLALQTKAADVVALAKSSGVSGGLVVQLDCTEADEISRLRLNDRYRVHGLSRDPAVLVTMRRALVAAGRYGQVAVARYDGRALPYVGNLVNLIVAAGPVTVPDAEILRVLTPGGKALIGDRALTKPWPPSIDEWGHYLHGPDNNAVAQDTEVGIPRSIQWVSEPRWGRSHEELASMSAAVIDDGRTYYIVDEAPLASIRFNSDWKLVARDAFNGTLLWERQIASWNDHLRHFRSGPAHLPRRLVAADGKVYVTLSFDGPVTELNGATGEPVRTLPGSERTEEILVDGKSLYVVLGTSETKRRGGGLHGRGEPKPSGFRRVAAYDVTSGKALWQRDFTKQYILPLTLVVRTGNVFLQTSTDLVCLEAATGKDRWVTPHATPARRMAFSAPTVVATDEVLLCADRDVGKGEAAQGAIEWGVNGWNENGFLRKAPSTLNAYAVSDGRQLWSAKCSEGYNSPVDVFVIDGTVWVGTGFQGYDLKTGEAKGKINTAAPRVGMPHHRCYRDKASERYIFTGKSGIEVLSLDKQRWLSNNSWVRGTCQFGIIPANGMLYAPPDPCACFLTVKAPGFFAVAPQREASGAMPFPKTPVLEKGPLYGKVSAVADTPGDWPMYRQNSRRSGLASAPLPQAVAKRWTTALAGRLTPPVVAEGVVVVAATDSHTVYALDAADGSRRWQFTAGGRVDGPPTIYRGMVLFGAADGWVYSLAAADGQLVWRFRAAPRERLVSVHDQIESIWPVHGAVLVQNDTLYATAGRSSYLDGGIVLYRLNPVTGEQLSRTVLSELDPETDKQTVPEARFNMEGTTSDVLSGDGESVYLKYFGFDRSGARMKETEPHLFAIAGLLGEEWFVRSYWVVGKGMPGAGWGGWANAANAFPAGRILCFNDDEVFGYGRQRVQAGPVGHRADAYHLFAMPREGKPAPPRKGKGQRGSTKAQPRWSTSESLIVRAMALGPERLAVAGPADLGKKDPDILAFDNQEEALAGFRGEKGVYLRIVSNADGRTLSQAELGAMPVFDGLAAAGGTLYLSLRNGSVTCFGAQ